MFHFWSNFHCGIRDDQWGRPRDFCHEKFRSGSGEALHFDRNLRYASRMKKQRFWFTCGFPCLGRHCRYCFGANSNINGNMDLRSIRRQSRLRRLCGSGHRHQGEGREGSFLLASGRFPENPEGGPGSGFDAAAQTRPPPTLEGLPENCLGRLSSPTRWLHSAIFLVLYLESRQSREAILPMTRAGYISKFSQLSQPAGYCCAAQD